jgi:hypothetical protein
LKAPLFPFETISLANAGSETACVNKTGASRVVPAIVLRLHADNKEDITYTLTANGSLWQRIVGRRYDRGHGKNPPQWNLLETMELK